jgi:hypothetical protein
MYDPIQYPRRLTIIAVVVEGGLAVVAVAIGWLIGRSPASSMSHGDLSQHIAAVAIGLLATLPMLVALVAMDRIPHGAWASLKQVVDQLLVPMFAKTSVAEMALISMAAGMGEELLFRGLLQSALGDWIGPPLGAWISLLVASLIFGACHWITPAYAAVASLIGVYLGWLLLATGNLWTPIVAHAFYDFVALVYLVKCKRTGA